MKGLFSRRSRKRRADPQELLQTIFAFIQARTWDESRRVVEEHPELLDDEADDLLGRLVDAARARGDEDAVRVFEKHHALLRRCREVGMETAFAEKIRPGGGILIPPEFQADLRRAQEALQRYLHTGARTTLDHAATAWEHILNHTAFAVAPERFQLAALNDAGGVFLRRYWTGGHLGDLNQALTCCQQAVERTPPNSPDLPRHLNNLGAGLRVRCARTDRLEDLEEAIRVYGQAVERTPPDSPDLTGYLNNLGIGLRDRYARTGRLEDLEEAIRVYQKGLAALDRAFLLSPVAYQLGQQARWTGLIVHAAETHRQAGKIDQALAIAEGSKSRLLTTLLGWGQLPAPPTVPPDLAQREQGLVARLAALDTADLARHGRTIPSDEGGAMSPTSGSASRCWRSSTPCGNR